MLEDIMYELKERLGFRDDIHNQDECMHSIFTTLTPVNFENINDFQSICEKVYYMVNLCCLYPNQTQFIGDKMADYIRDVLGCMFAESYVQIILFLCFKGYVKYDILGNNKKLKGVNMAKGKVLNNLYIIQQILIERIGEENITSENVIYGEYKKSVFEDLQLLSEYLYTLNQTGKLKRICRNYLKIGSKEVSTIVL